MSMTKMLYRITVFVDNLKMIIHGILKEGEVWAGRKEAKRRIEICNGCKFFDKDLKMCEDCGCFMEVKTKFKNASCTRKKWS